jgi:hypothetical protein
VLFVLSTKLSVYSGLSDGHVQPGPMYLSICAVLQSSLATSMRWTKETERYVAEVLHQSIIRVSYEHEELLQMLLCLLLGKLSIF